ncbi:Os03g0325400, partial [Oryza sativa Japonica Group]
GRGHLLPHHGARRRRWEIPRREIDAVAQPTDGFSVAVVQTSADKMERKFSIELYGRHAIPEGGVRESDADKAERNRDAGSFFLRKDEEEYITS